MVALAEVRSYEQFAAELRPVLHRALVGRCGIDGAADAAAEALAYAWEHWDEVQVMENPAGYLYRVGVSRSRTRKQGLLPAPGDLGLPEVEPRLVDALRRLPRRQLTVVWLVHACGWRPAEAAVALDISPSAVATHAARGLARLRAEIGGRDAV